MTIAARLPLTEPRRLTYRSAAGVRFAVVDLETTGLDPCADRVVECAVVEVDRGGHVIAEWSTLVSIPGSAEVGALGIHGISRQMLDGAPVFADVITDLAARLAGRVIVGHVLAFDLEHLRSEFARSGVCLPVLNPSGLCTRELARAFLPPGPRNLQACCQAAAVECGELHTALGDARATAGLLGHFLLAGYPIDYESRSRHGDAIVWPNLERRARSSGRRSTGPIEPCDAPPARRSDELVSRGLGRAIDQTR